VLNHHIYGHLLWWPEKANIMWPWIRVESAILMLDEEHCHLHIKKPITGCGGTHL
jgi:hypothetical protein